MAITLEFQAMVSQRSEWELNYSLLTYMNINSLLPHVDYQETHHYLSIFVPFSMLSTVTIQSLNEHACKAAYWNPSHVVIIIFGKFGAVVNDGQKDSCDMSP